jgi:hypothetical protein
MNETMAAQIADKLREVLIRFNGSYPPPDGAPTNGITPDKRPFTDDMGATQQRASEHLGHALQLLSRLEEIV